MSREVLYVMLIRALLPNRAYVSTDRIVEPLKDFTDDLSVLAAVLRNVGASASAHEVHPVRAGVGRTDTRLAAEYEIIARLAQAPRWAAMLRRRPADAGAYQRHWRVTGLRSAGRRSQPRPTGSSVLIGRSDIAGKLLSWLPPDRVAAAGRHAEASRDRRADVLARQRRRRHRVGNR